VTAQRIYKEPRRDAASGPPEPLYVVAVEDKEADAELIALTLRRDGFTVTLDRVDTRDGLMDVLNDRPDVALVDYSLPRYDPRAAVQLIKEIQPGVPILVMSGAVGDDALAKLTRLGADDYIQKDRTARLGQSVRQLLRQSKGAEAVQAAQLAQRRSAILFHALFEQSSDGVLLIDASSGCVIEANAHAAVLLGIPAENLIGQKYSSILPPGARQVLSSYLDGEEDIGAPVNLPVGRTVVAIARADQSTVYIEAAASLIQPPASHSILQVILRDVSERLRLIDALRQERDHLDAIVAQRTAQLSAANAELREANLQLEAASRLRRKFLRNMHHELKTPLTTIIGHTDLLLDQDIDGAQRGPIARISDAGQHLLGLINDMLDLTEIESGTLRFSMTSVPPALMVEGAIAVLGDRILRSGITVTSTIDPGLRAVRGDVNRCRQIMLNLLTNAIKFTPRGGAVEVRCRFEKPDRALITVRDTGRGISEHDLEHIFEEFYQVDRASDTAAGGTGIGLALTRSLVERQGGSIHVESQLGKGTCFTVVLQGVPSDEAAAAGADHSQAP